MSESKLTAGDILMRRLRQHGVDYVFANGGTDFGPIIEALARGGPRVLQCRKAW